MSLSITEEPWLERFLDETDGDTRLSKWETDFVADQRKRFAEFGTGMNMSPKQWGILRRIADKIGFDTADAGDDA